MGKINNKTKLVFITGASRGIGQCLAKTFAKRGYNVAFGYNKNKKLADYAAKDFSMHSIQVDIASKKSIYTAIEKTKDLFKSNIDILINNAAIAQEKPFLKITDDDWEKMLRINLRGAFLFAQAVIPAMIEKKWGRIINIASIGGQWGGYNQVHYAASKAGLISLTQSLAKLFSKHKITSNAVSPGLVSTEMSVAELKSEKGQRKVASIPLGRIATAEEIAAVATFLASEKASYITGQTINANGGMYFG